MLADKAAANLRAGDILAAAGLIDPAASRYYYAMFQAAVHRLTVLGWTPGRLSSGAVEWNHTMVANNVLLVRRLRSDRDLFRALRELRESADYEVDGVESGEMLSYVNSVREFVEESIR